MGLSNAAAKREQRVVRGNVSLRSRPGIPLQQPAARQQIEATCCPPGSTGAKPRSGKDIEEYRSVQHSDAQFGRERGNSRSGFAGENAAAGGFAERTGTDCNRQNRSICQTISQMTEQTRPCAVSLAKNGTSEAPASCGQMKTSSKTIDRQQRNLDLDIREAIIHALYVRLRAERETREAIAAAARAGAAPEVLEAMACDPVPIETDPAQAKLVQTLVKDFRRSGLYKPASSIDTGT